MPIQSAAEGRTSTYYPNTTNLPEKSKLSKITPILGGTVGGGVLATAGVMAYMHHAAIAGAFTTAGKAIIGAGATALGSIGGGVVGIAASAGITARLHKKFNPQVKAFNSLLNKTNSSNDQEGAESAKLSLHDFLDFDHQTQTFCLKESVTDEQAKKVLYNHHGQILGGIGGTTPLKLVAKMNAELFKDKQAYAERAGHDDLNHISQVKLPLDVLSKSINIAIKKPINADISASLWRKSISSTLTFAAGCGAVGGAAGALAGAGIGAAPVGLIAAAAGLVIAGVVNGAIHISIKKEINEDLHNVGDDLTRQLMAKSPQVQNSLESTSTRDEDDTVEMGPYTGGRIDKNAEVLAAASAVPLPDNDDGLLDSTVAAESTEFSDGYHIDLMHESQKPSDTIPQVIEPAPKTIEATQVQETATSQVDEQHLSKKSPLSQFRDNPRPATTFAGMGIPEGQDDEAQDEGITPQSNRSLFPINTTLFRNGSNASSYMRTPTPTSANEGNPIFSGQTALVHRPTNVSGHSIESSMGVMDSISRAGSTASVKTSTHRPSTSRREHVLSTVLESSEDKRSSAGSATTLKEAGSTTGIPKRDFSFVRHSKEIIDQGFLSGPERELKNIIREREAREARESSSSTLSVETTRSQISPQTFGEFIKSEASESGFQKIHALFDKQIKQHTSLEGFVSNLIKDEYLSPRTLDPKEQLLLDAFNNFNLKDPEGSVQARNALNHLLEM